MNFIRLIVAFSCFLTISTSLATSVWTPYSYKGSSFKFKSSKTLPISVSGDELIVELDDLKIVIKESDVKKLKVYSLNKKVKVFRKELKENNIRLLRSSGPVRGHISQGKIRIWEYQFFYQKDGERYSLGQSFFECGKNIFELSYILDKKARFDRKLRFNLKRVLTNLRCK